MSIAVISVMSDAVPTADVEAGDVAALFRAHYARLVRALAVVSGDGDLAADAVQEAFTRLHRRWSTIRHYEDPVGWVRRVALNLLSDDRRRNQRKWRAVERLAAMTATSTPAPSEPTEVSALVAALPRQQRIAIALFYVDGLSVAEVAAAMGISQGSVKSHLHDARRSLRVRLGGER